MAPLQEETKNNSAREDENLPDNYEDIADML